MNSTSKSIAVKQLHQRPAVISWLLALCITVCTAVSGSHIHSHDHHATPDNDHHHEQASHHHDGHQSSTPSSDTPNQQDCVLCLLADSSQNTIDTNWHFCAVNCQIFSPPLHAGQPHGFSAGLSLARAPPHLL